MKNKKKIIYYVNPLFFKDENNDGFGDLSGFISKIDYIKSVGFNQVIFPDIFNNINDINLKHYVPYNQIYSDIHLYPKVIQELKNNDIDFIQEINIKRIEESLLYKSSDQNLKSKDIKDFYLDKNFGDNKFLKWNLDKNLLIIKQIISELKNKGVNKIAIADFVFLSKKNEVLSANTISILKKICDTIREVDENIKIYISSSKLSFNDIKTLNTQKIGNFYIKSSLLNRNHKIIKNMKRSIKKNLSNKSINNHGYLSKTFASIGNVKGGRMNSIMGSENILFNESGKALNAISIFAPWGAFVLSGDEIGTLNVDLEEYSELNDPYIIEKKADFLSHRGNEETNFKKNVFMNSSINSNSYFQWNDSENLGFTQANIKKMLWKITTKNKYINWDFQNQDKNSVLNFCKASIQFVNESKYSKYFNEFTKVKIQIIRGIVSIKYWIEKENIIVFLNLDYNIKKLKISKNKEIIFSSNLESKINSYNKYLLPYEMVILKTKNY